MQSADNLSALLRLIVEPLTHRPLESVHGNAPSPDLLRTSGREYVVRDGIPHLVPRDEDIVQAVGAASYRAWRALQDAAEESYGVRVEGHFSVPGYQPAVDYGVELAAAPTGVYLDVGCGVLPTPVYMNDSPAKRFVGIDPVDVPVVRTFPFARALGDFLPFRRGSFDGVLFSSALDHCISPARALSEAFRVLRPRGVLFVFETLRPNDRRFQQWRSNARERPTRYNKHHNWAFTEDSLMKTVARVGFVVESIKRTSDPSEGVLKAHRPPASRLGTLWVRGRNRLSDTSSRFRREARYMGPM